MDAGAHPRRNPDHARRRGLRRARSHRCACRLRCEQRRGGRGDDDLPLRRSCRRSLVGLVAAGASVVGRKPGETAVTKPAKASGSLAAAVRDRAQMCQSGEKPSESVRPRQRPHAWWQRPGSRGRDRLLGPRRKEHHLRLELGSRVDCIDEEFGELVDVVVDPATRGSRTWSWSLAAEDLMPGSSRSTWRRPATMRVEQSSFG